MNYSINTLTQVADCNEVLRWAEIEKADLDYRRITVERLTSRYAATSQEIEAQYQGLLTEIAGQQSILAILPDGPARDEVLDRITRLEYKRFLLENRRESYGTVALLEKEVDLGRVYQEIAEVDVFIAAVTAHMETLSA